PIRTAVDRLWVQLPPDYQFDREVGATPTELVEDVAIDPESRTAMIKLAQRQARAFSITLPGVYLRQNGGGKSPALEEVALDLPRPVGWSRERSGEGERRPAVASGSSSLLDRGGHVQVDVPEGWELLPRGLLAAGPLSGGRELTWNSDRFPTRVALAWQP